MKFSSVTFGCKVNQYETQMMRELLGQFFEEAAPGEAVDLVLINTCAVTGEAERQARQALRRARKRHPNARIIVAGCYARRLGVDLVQDGLADQVVSAPTAEAFLAALNMAGGDPRRSANITRFDGHARAFVKVQDGCDRRCSFCVIPLIRGNSSSRPLTEIVEEIRGLAGHGVPEVVLCGVRLNAYKDPETGARLDVLLERVLEISALYRLRLSSLYPGKLAPELIELIAGHPRMCKHVHLPIQSGSDAVLKAMRRGYTSADIRDLAGRLRARCPNLGLTADVLVGFPSECETDVDQTAELIEACGFHKIHLFPFSPRPGTPAEHLALLPAPVVAARKERLAQLGSRLQAVSLAQQVGREVHVVVEGQPQAGWWRGWTDSYHPVKFQSQQVHAGSVARVKIIGVSPSSNRGGGERESLLAILPNRDEVSGLGHALNRDEVSGLGQA